jgi:hypothetical protein
LGGVEVESSSVACEGGGEAEEGLLDLDSPWVAADEAESRLGAAATAVAEDLATAPRMGTMKRTTRYETTSSGRRTRSGITIS